MDSNKFRLLYELEVDDDTNLTTNELVKETEMKEIRSDNESKNELTSSNNPKYDKSITDYDSYLNSRRQLRITYNVNKYGKIQTNERQFNVVSRHTYENLKKLIMRHKTHKEGKINWEEQTSKIKLANNLMSLCFKESSQKCAFVYPVIIITLKNGKTITKNYIKEGSSLQFTINDIVYNMRPPVTSAENSE
jgi:hypothetical protein